MLVFLDIDSTAGKMRYGLSYAQQLELNDVPVDASDVDIACMLEPYLAENDIAPVELAGYLLRSRCDCLLSLFLSGACGGAR
jgi:hypothetical protein